MSLQNLLATGNLVKFEAQRDDIQRLLAAAERNLGDAGVNAISDENRFDAAYKCVMQCASAALWANGCRTPTSKPGHHQITIQTLPLTVGLDTKTMVVLDGLRRQRNVNDYNGDPVSPTMVEACLTQAKALLAHVRAWLMAQHPEFC
jgi:hypothetical protein